jgi:hypothetical protein
MERIFSMLRSFVDDSEKTKFCVACGNKATQEALFDVGDGAILIEKYCDTCVTSVQKRQ